MNDTSYIFFLYPLLPEKLHEMPISNIPILYFGILTIILNTNNYKHILISSTLFVIQKPTALIIHLLINGLAYLHKFTFSFVMNSLTPVIAIADINLANQVKELVMKLPFMQPPIVCQSGTQLLGILNTQDANILFWGADFTDIPGFDLFQLQTNLPPVIVVSHSKEMALAAFDVGALDYLVSPLIPLRFQKACYRALQVMSHASNLTLADKIMVKIGRKIHAILFDEILFIEAYGMYSKICKPNGKVLVINDVITRLEHQLPAKIFTRVHKSYIVNIQKITSFDKKNLYIDDKAIEIGVTYKLRLNSWLKLLDKE